MLTIAISNYYGYNDKKNKIEKFILDSTKEEFFNHIKKAHGDRLDTEFWKSLGYLRIKVDENKDILIYAKESSVISYSSLEFNIANRIGKK